MARLLLGLAALAYGVYMIATAPTMAEKHKNRPRVFGYNGYSVANLRLVGAGFCLLGLFALATASSVDD